MHYDSPYVLRATQTHVLPRAAAVLRFVNAVTPRRAALVVRLSRSNPEDFRIARRQRDVADGRRALVVEYRLPRCAGVVRLPDPTGCCRRIHELAESIAYPRLGAFGYGERNHPPTCHRRAYRPPREFRQHRRIVAGLVEGDLRRRLLDRLLRRLGKCGERR